MTESPAHLASASLGHPLPVRGEESLATRFANA